jgi:hypothetical protein
MRRINQGAAADSMLAVARQTRFAVVVSIFLLKSVG